MMTTRVSADASICGYKNSITVTRTGKSIKIEMAGDCSHIKRYADNLREIELKDLYSMEGSAIIKKATSSGISPSCIVPAAIMNACWVECGMISRNLALEKKELKIIFEE